MDEKRRLRIAFVTHPHYYCSFRHPIYAVCIVTSQIARRLVQNNDCEVVVYTRLHRKTLKKETESREGVTYQYIPTVIDRLLLKIIDKIPGIFDAKHPIFASNFYYMLYGIAIAKEMRKHNMDIVHIHDFSQYIPIIRAYNHKMKIVLHLHMQWLTQLDHDKIAQRLQHADLVIGVSEFITEKVRRQFPECASKCQTVYNGVDSHFYNRRDMDSNRERNGIKQLLYVGRVSPEKGVHILLKAFEKVVQQFPKVHLNIVGPLTTLAKEHVVTLGDDDPKVADLISFYTADPDTGKQLTYFEQLQKLISPELAQHITFIGAIPHEKLNTYYRNADIFINPALREPFGMPIPEAMAGSLPIIGSRVGGIPELILNEKTGFLVESGDATELAGALLRLLNNDHLRTAMGEASYQRAVDLFSWDRIAEKLLLHYENLC